jgi:hypothetical protein
MTAAAAETRANKQYDTAIRSLAVELHRLGHAKELPADEDDRVGDRIMNLGFLAADIPDLCSYSLSALVDVVSALHTVAHDAPGDREREPLS